MTSIFKRRKGDPRGRWQAAFSDAYGVRRMKSTGTTIYQDALRIAHKWESDAALRREGVIDIEAETIAQRKLRSIKEALIEFDSEIRAAGHAKGADLIYAHLTGIFQLAGFRCLGDIRVGPVLGALAQIKASGCPGTQRRTQLPLSTRTIRVYAMQARRFTRWLVSREQVVRDPLISLQIKGNTVRVFRRRMLLPDEFVWLQKTLTPGDELAQARLLLYTTAIQTGYRAAEMASIRPPDLFLTAPRPYISLTPERTKNRCLAIQYVKPGLASALAEYARTVPPVKALWWRLFDGYGSNGKPRVLWANYLREDLALSRFKWKLYGGDDASDFLRPVNNAGERLDFHSLRHSCGAWLVLAGTNIKVVQEVMRHHSITLTMDTYGHMLPGAAAEAVAAFPETEPLALPAPGHEWGSV